MLHPYRRMSTQADHGEELRAGARWDDLVLGIVMLVLGVPRLLIALATAETFGAEATIATITSFLGLLLVSLRRR